MTHPLPLFIKRFLIHYLPVQKGVAANTILAYRDTIRLLVRFTADSLRKPADRLLVEDITGKLVVDFLDHIERRRRCSPRTRNARLAAIRSLFTFIGREEPETLEQCRRIRTIPLKRTQHKTIDYLEEKEMKAVLQAVNINTRTAIRDRALLLLLYNTGARVSEITALNIADLQLDDPGQVHLLGKGNKHRNCPLWPETVAAIKAYLLQRAPQKMECNDCREHGTENHTVFLNANDVSITRFGVRYIIKRYAAAASRSCQTIRAKTINPHCIRHTTAMHLLRSGNDINMISYWLGHASLNTTHIYIEIDMEMKRKMLEKTSPPRTKIKAPWHKPELLQWLDNLNKEPELCAVNH